MVSFNELTEEMKAELELSREELARAKLMPITFDEACPEVTPEMAVKFRKVNPPRSPKNSDL